MLTSVLIKLGLAIFSALPIERIIAALLNKWIAKIDDTNIDKARKTANHLAELSALFDDILNDKQVSPEEVGQMREAIMRARERLLAAWARGADAKALQTALGEQRVKAEYVEPLLVGIEKKQGGFVRPGCVCVLGLLCSLALACGCLTRTRCQSIDANTVYVTINCNDPDTLAENAYPRSLSILSQDQQVEGGSDSIASGNKTDPSLQVPMGDSALGYLGQLLGGMFKSTSAAPAEGAAATNGAAAAAGSGAACAGGACSE
jgi:hypothetical protein